MAEAICEKSQTADGDTPHESPNRVGDLEVLDEKYSCRCGFIGETAEEVWEHQQEEMQDCVDSDCSGRMDECDHCPEIATGDAQREPLVSINAVVDQVKTVGRGDHRSGIWYGRCYNCMDVNASTHSWFECKACGKENRHPAHPCDRDKTAVDVKGAVSREKLSEALTQKGDNQ